jgi:peptidoglycan biosynthesis protein MviN/MurJ (putative lipid II flippase)
LGDESAGTFGNGRLKAMQKKLERRSLLVFFASGFVYSCLLALVMQKLLLPMVPEMHAGHGLLKNDAIIFHQAAVDLAGKIQAHGWSEWALFPSGSTGFFTGNVGVLAALYAWFGPEPAVFIPLNAAAHATGALMLVLIGPLLWPSKPGRLGGLGAGIAFIAFPSALLWYGQNHKDAFAIAGTLMMLYAWLRLQWTGNRRLVVLRLFLLAGAGIGLLAIVRPYFTMIVAAAFACSWLASACWLLLRKELKSGTSSLALGLVFVCLVLAAAVGTSKSTGTHEGFDNVLIASEQIGEAEGDAGGEAEGEARREVKLWKWQETPGLPAEIDGMFRRVSELRVHFIRYAQSVGAGSGIDEHRIPSDVGEVLAYLPRALFVGLFAPFPDSWSKRVSLPRLAAAIETSIWYIFFLGLIVLAIRHPSRELLAGLVFCAAIVTVLFYANPNIGTLYRTRYGVWMFLLLGGAVGWASLTIGLLSHVEHSHHAAHRIPGVLAETSGEESPGLNLSSLAASGALTMLITFVGYLGFLARDLLLVHANGLSTGMDSLFAAMMLPMVFVNCLSIPISDAITMPFVKLWTKADPEEGQRFIRSILFWASLIMGASAAAAFLFAAPAMRVILGSDDHQQISNGAIQLRLFTPIVLLSAWTVVGNTVLNALHRFQDSALAQLAVPTCSVAAILLAPPGLLPIYAILGMVVGTLANAVIVAVLCLRQGVVLRPSPSGCPDSTQSIASAYGWLVFAALFTAAISPVNYFFAGMAGEGGVSGWALSCKMILLFNGLLVAAVTTVFLPHIARTIARSTRPQTGCYFIFLLLGGTWVAGLLLLGVSEFAEPLVAALIGGSQVTADQIQTLAQVLRVGMIQLPVLVVGAIVIKAAAVTQRSSRAVLASAIALVVNMIASGLLVPSMGILGIAYASLGATAVGTLFLVFAMCRQCGMSLSVPWVLLLTWVGWAVVSLSIASGNLLNLAGAVSVILVLGLAHFFVWRMSLRNARAIPPVP